MLTATLTPPASAPTRTLDKTDRCDSCQAQAWMHATKNSSELYFCAHHGRKHYRELVKQGFAINDQSHLINAKPSQSSA